ncbi:MAG: MerR family transcriptional regulator [Pseudomonadota bacterium]
MNISEAARRSGLTTKTIRYYESIGLIEPVRRSANGYRRYDHASVAELRFLARAREAGFDLQESRQLLELLRDSSRQSRRTRALVLEKRRRLKDQIGQLQAMLLTLDELAGRCAGDDGPDCAILDDLSTGAGGAA